MRNFQNSLTNSAHKVYTLCVRTFIGRKDYLDQFRSLWSLRQTRLISVYGRRRIGKTAILHKFAEGKKAFLFEAIEGEDTPAQIRHFLEQLSRFVSEPHLKDLIYKDWPPVFELFTEIINREKSLVVAFDELPWMAAGRSKLISLIKYYWDNRWKQHPHLLFILCGSMASWMIKNCVRATALYGRISENILVEPLKPFEVCEFISTKRGRREALEYYLCYGGIPRYLEEFDFNKSIQLNIENTSFSPSGFFVEEADKIFYNQFKETGIYKKIVNYLFNKPLSLQQISDKIKIPSGGGLKLYLDNLAVAGLVDKKPELKSFKLVKNQAYFITDEFLHFYQQFIKPNLSEIKLSGRLNKFEKITRNKWEGFLGFAFERFCLKQRYVIAELLGFGDKVDACGSILNKEQGGFQFDLVFVRRDNTITLCEVKYLSSPPLTQLIKDFEGKISRAGLSNGKTLERVLICSCPPSRALADSGYFHHILLAEDIMNFNFNH